MKNIIILTLILTFTSQLKAQNYNIYPKPKAGKCYCVSTKENSKAEWKEVDCELMKLKKEELTSLQYKLKNLNYDVDITGCIDEKTNIAYITEKKEKKIRERQERKRLRKAKKTKNKSENELLMSNKN